jgi:hypothetical protein
MGDQLQLDCEVLHLLHEANVRMLANIIGVAGTKDQIIRMRDCAEHAGKVGLAQSAQRLRDAADALETRVQSRPHA